MPQRMQGYTEFRGTPWPSAEGVAVAATPQEVREDVSPALIGGAPAEVVPTVPAAPAVEPVASAPAAEPVAPAVAAAPAPVAEASAPQNAWEPGRRMAGYMSFQGTPWPPVGGIVTAPVAAEAPAAAATPAEAPMPAPDAHTAPAVDVAEPATPVAVPMPTSTGEPYLPGRRMAGYTAFRGAPWPPNVGPADTADRTQDAAPASPVAPPTAAPKHAEQAPSAPATPASKPAPKPAAKASPVGKADMEKPAPTLGRRIGIAVGAVVVVAALAVLGARWLITVPAVADFVTRYPGVPDTPETTPTGIPAWLVWQHFLNLFLMALIIRTGLQIRHETRPPANFTPKKPGLFAPPGSSGSKFSITIWLHQALDLLWLLNGLVFVVLLLATGHWMRLIPLDPETPQHMLSTALQYATLDWPEHDGWLHYNAMQMTAYAGVVFILAPIAALTGFRMSSWWPAESKALTKAFPMDLARKVHFPTMVLFSAFIVVHVFLVVFSGVLYNLNTMFLARNAGDWWGLVAFLVAMAVTAVAWVLLKPSVISPVAERFGRVGR